MADERLWGARDEELSMYGEAPPAIGAGLYRAALDRYAAAALAAGPKVPAKVLDDLANDYVALDSVDRATPLMEAAARNDDDPNREHSVAWPQYTQLLGTDHDQAKLALLAQVDPVKTPMLVDMIVGDVTLEQPALLLPRRASFDRWGAGHPATVMRWLVNLASALADARDTGDGRACLADAVRRLGERNDAGDEWEAARGAIAAAAARLGEDDLAWSFARARRGDHDRFVALVSTIASGALDTGRDTSADRALALLAKPDAGSVYEHALSGAARASVSARRHIVARALAFAAGAEALQAYRIHRDLAREAAGQLDLPDLLPAILSAAATRRASLTIEAGQQASVSAEVAREQGKPALQAVGRARATALARAALAAPPTLTDEQKLDLSRLCANVRDLASSRRVADAIADAYKREQAYTALLNLLPPTS